MDLLEAYQFTWLLKYYKIKNMIKHVMCGPLEFYFFRIIYGRFPYNSTKFGSGIIGLINNIKNT